MSSEPEKPTSEATGSLADRMTFPSKPAGTNPDAPSFTPGAPSGFSWADDVPTPVSANPTNPLDAKPAEGIDEQAKDEKPQDGAKDTAAAEEADPAEDQLDGAGDYRGGSSLQEPDYDVDVKLADIQADPNNPLFSVKSFEELQLPPEIVKGLFAMNFRKPSKIQERALPLLLKDPPTNLIGQSQSGTGKTAAFTLNILARIDTNNPAPQALILAPSRELARQILGVVQTMGQFMTKLKVAQAIPDPAQRNRKLEGQVVVGTPGTTMDMIKRRYLESAQLKVLVLDEADNMLDQQGLGDQCKRVRALIPKNVQVTLFSATFPEEVLRFADAFAPKANQITLKVAELSVEGIKQLYLDCESEKEKYDVLVKFYGLMTIASSIIFVKRRDTAVEIERRMTAEGHHVAMLTGALEGTDRDAVIDSFRSGKAKVLITTNVLARGIDVQSVSMVINYDVPENQGRPDPETYLHRIGRTGRFGRVGVAITFVHDRTSWGQLMAISEHFGTQPMRLDAADWDSVEATVKKVIKSSRAGTNLKAV